MAVADHATATGLVNLATMQSQKRLDLRLDRLHHVAGLVAVEAHQPVRLVEPMLADQRRALQRQHGAGIGDRREGAVIDAAQAEIVVEPARLAHDIGIGRRIGTDDHLSRLARGRETRSVLEALPRILRLDEIGLHLAHRAFDLARILVGRETGQAAVGRQQRLQNVGPVQ